MRVRRGVRVWGVVVAALAAVAGQGLPAVADDGVGAPVVLVTPAGQWVTSPEASASWSVDFGGELAGWAVSVDEEPSTDPGSVVTQTDASWSGWLPDGVHWLHVRAIGADGTPGALTHARIGVDTTGPVVAGVTSTVPDGQVWSSTQVPLSWDVPDDVSGVAGYQVVVASGEGSGPDDSSTGSVTTDVPSATVTVPGDGDWLVGVRAVDGAGLWGPYATYEVLVDKDAPGLPVVSGSHQSGTAATQRHVVLTFAQGGGGDDVRSWVARIDQSPTGTLDVGDGRPEPRIVADLAPGQWWLHVAGVDGSGRLGAVADYSLVIQDGDYVLDVPAGQHLWGPGWHQVWCPQVPDAVVESIDSDGTRAQVAALGRAGDHDGRCGFTWDPTVTNSGGRVWPDGEYQLVVVAGGQDVSEPVAVTVAATEGPVERIDADYEVGLIDAEQQATLLIQATAGTLGAPYQVEGGATTAPTAVDLVTAMTADGSVSQAMADLLTPVPQSAQARASAPKTATSVASSPAAGCAELYALADLVFDCVATSEHFVVFYGSLQVGPTSEGQSVPDFVARMITSLERARAIYQDQGFKVPAGPVQVALSWAMTAGAGVSLPKLDAPNGLQTIPTILMSSSVDRVKEYLPDHEFFHQVQYQYFDAARMGLQVNNPYWWMEATAEWGAKLVQTEAEYTGDPFEATPDYASQLGDFMANSRGRYDAGNLATGGGPEYGAFALAEFMSEKYGNEAIAQTWTKIGRPWLGQSPAQAIRSVIQDHGDNYADQIHLFRTWMYTLDDTAGWGSGFSAPDADVDGFWRYWIGSDARPPHDSVTFAGDDTQVSGSVHLSAGSAQYVEFTNPSGRYGSVSVTVSGPEGAVRASLLGNVTVPHRCPTLISRAAPATAQVTTFGTQTTAPMSAAVGSGDCGDAVLVITNSSPMPSPTLFGDLPDLSATYTWTATFAPFGDQLTNGTITVDLTAGGALSTPGAGVARESSTTTMDDDSWRVTAGSASGGANGVYAANGLVGDLEYVSSSWGADAATTVGEIGDLTVTHQVHPSPVADLYQVDVTVTRTAGAPAVPDPVTYRRTGTWASRNARYPSWQTWQKAPGGDDSQVSGLSLVAPAPAQDGSVTYHQSGYGTWGPTRWVDWRSDVSIDVNLGVISPGDSTTFTLYYGLATTRSAALADLDSVGADVFYLNYSQYDDIEPFTGMFAYRAGRTIQAR